jgi:beta-N-acetylhexosaminidase
MLRRFLRLLSACLCTLLLTAATGCSAVKHAFSSDNKPSGHHATAASPPAKQADAATAQLADPGRTLWLHMSESQRVGQLFMLGADAAHPTTTSVAATKSLIKNLRLGSVIYMGASVLSVSQVHWLSSQLQSVSGPAKLLISTDQEGGDVQRFKGPGFSPHIPTAVDQGQLSATILRQDWVKWARQLRAAGVNTNLAPVLDIVPTGFGSNPPIGDLDREYGHTAARVTSRGVAAEQGMLDAHVATTVKHFPGLGRVHGNTDLKTGVTDWVTTRHDAYLAPFAGAVKAGTPFVMMSLAYYHRIDPTRPAAFSSLIMRTMLRSDLGFKGTIVSDSLGATQLKHYSYAQRAIRFISAGGDIALVIQPNLLTTMVRAVKQRLATDPTFKAKVDAAALNVLRTKAMLGLI